MADFKIPPVSPLVGCTLPNFYKAINAGRVEAKYAHKVALTGLICGLASPFHLWDKMHNSNIRPANENPVFIIGHWRSGTTYLHNLLCQDPGAGYITTYQSLFPNNLHSKWLFRSFVKWKIPAKRPGDNVELGVDLPQEDEFALENLAAPSFYHFFFFPEDFRLLFKQNVLFCDKNGHEIERWKSFYKQLIDKGAANTNGRHMVLKNPANTGRTDKILEMYPQARFIHIYRNPVMVYLSAKKFFLALFPTLQLQQVSRDQIIDLIFELYSLLMKTYIDKKDSIPESQLFELAFESFEKEPLRYVKDLYEHLEIDNWEQAEPRFKKYLSGLKDYQKNQYRISRWELDRILAEWGFAFEYFDYEIPTDLKVV